MKNIPCRDCKKLLECVGKIEEQLDTNVDDKYFEKDERPDEFMEWAAEVVLAANCPILYAYIHVGPFNKTSGRFLQNQERFEKVQTYFGRLARIWWFQVGQYGPDEIVERLPFEPEPHEVDENFCVIRKS